MTVIDVRGQARPDDVERERARVDPREEHPDFLAHHFETPRQQFEAAKLGMWLFLGTEVLLFGGLFCVYAIFRGNHPEVFSYGSGFLDTRWGATNTAILLISSMTMALSVTAAQRGQRRLLIAMLLSTFMGGAMFMSIKYIEYYHKFEQKLMWGVSFYEKPEWLIQQEQLDAMLARRERASQAAFVADPAKGVALWMATCRTCHGLKGEGVPGQGLDQRGSAFIASQNDAELVAFIQKGRTPGDPLNTTGLQMPPSGGNPLLTTEDLFHVVSYVRTFDPAPTGEGEAAAPVEVPFSITRTVIPDPRPGPEGMNYEVLADLEQVGPVMETHEAAAYPHHTEDPQRPANAHMFFSIYFLMTGLHGIHVLVGMVVIAWLAFGAVRGRYGPRYFTPIDLGGLYWHVVDLIWIFLFPLFYLIH